MSEGIPFDDQWEAFLIAMAAASPSEKVVVLFDEYDKRIIDTLCNKPLQDEVVGVMDSIFLIIKGNSNLIKLSLVTGITNFNLVGLYSGGNYYTNISYEENIGTAFGFTEKEVVDNFSNHIQSIADKYYNDLILLANETEEELPDETEKKKQSMHS